MMRQALSRLFHAAEGFGVCGEASNGDDALELARVLEPDLMVLDLCMPGMNGLETAQKLKDLGLKTRVILYSLHADDIAGTEASLAGVNAMVSKAEGVKTLITRARALLDASPA